MKDGALRACVGMAFIFGTYSVFMWSHVVTDTPIPDGIIFGTVVAAVAALAGYVYAKAPKEA